MIVSCWNIVFNRFAEAMRPLCLWSCYSRKRMPCQLFILIIMIQSHLCPFLNSIFFSSWHCYSHALDLLTPPCFWNRSDILSFSSSMIGLWCFLLNTRLAVNRVKPWLTKMINSSSSNTMIQIENLDLGFLTDTLNYLATPTPKSSRFLITISWIM